MDQISINMYHAIINQFFFYQTYADFKIIGSSSES